MSIIPFVKLFNSSNISQNVLKTFIEQFEPGNSGQNVLNLRKIIEISSLNRGQNVYFVKKFKPGNGGQGEALLVIARDGHGSDSLVGAKPENKFNLLYSGGSNTEYVRISDGPKMFHWQMVRFSNGLDIWLPFCSDFEWFCSVFEYWVFEWSVPVHRCHGRFGSQW